MAITAAHLVTTDDLTSGTTIASGSVTPTNNSLVLVTFVLRNQDANADPGNPSSVVGGGSHAYTLVNGVLLGSRRRVCVYRALSSSYTAGAITGTWAINVAGSINVDEFAGIDTGGANGASAIVQSATAGPTTGTGLTVTLAAFGAADHAAFGGFGHEATEATTPGGSFVELGESATATNMGSQTEYFIGDADPVVTWVTSVSGSGVGVEIKIAAAAAATIAYRRSLLGVGP